MDETFFGKITHAICYIFGESDKEFGDNIRKVSVAYSAIERGSYYNCNGVVSAYTLLDCSCHKICIVI